MTTRKKNGRSRAVDEVSGGGVPQADGPAAAVDDPDALRADIEATRSGLGDSVEALAAKADVKTGAKDAANAAARAVRRRPAPVAVVGVVVVAALGAVVLVRRRRHVSLTRRVRAAAPWRWSR